MKCKWVFWVMDSGGGQDRGGWINESVYLVSVGGWVCVCVGVLSVGLGPGLDSMSPARSRRSASHAAGTHGRLPQKTGRPGLRRGGVGGYNLHSVPPNSPPDCGTPTTSRLYPFGANPSSPDVSLSSASLITSQNGDELRPSAHPYRIRDTEPISTSRRLTGPDTGRR